MPTSAGSERRSGTARRATGARSSSNGCAPRSTREIASLDDLADLPFTDKSDLRENYPFGLLRVPRVVVRVHASSGSHGKPTVVGYTAPISRPGPR